MRSFLILGAALVAIGACAPVQSAEPVDLAQRCDPAAGQSLIGSHVGAVDFASNANVRIICNVQNKITVSRKFMSKGSRLILVGIWP